MLRLQQLNLERYRQSILHVANLQSGQHFTAFHHGTNSGGLQAIKTLYTVSIGLSNPLFPQVVDCLVKNRIRDDGTWLDTGTNQVGNQCIHRIERP